jgi:hypothetical protein
MPRRHVGGCHSARLRCQAQADMDEELNALRKELRFQPLERALKLPN